MSSSTSSPSPSNSASGAAKPTHRTSALNDGGTSSDALASQLASVLSHPSAPHYVAYSPFVLVSLRAPLISDADQSYEDQADFPDETDKPSSSRKTLHAHLSDYYDFEQDEAEDDRALGVQPHVYQIAARAFFYLRRTGQDQAILFHSACSVACSGQQEHRRLTTRALLSLASNPQDPSGKSARVARQIQAAEFIIDAFGCVGTSATSTSATTRLGLSDPRYGRYAELQMGDRGRIVGYKTLLYGLDLDTGRISFSLDGGVSSGIQNRERSFNAVRWLVAGATKEERQYLMLPEGLAVSGSTADAFDRERFGLLKQAFKTFGVPKRAVASLCSTLAAILHICSLQFVPSESSDALEGCSIANPETLHTVASLLGLLDVPSSANSNLSKLTEAFTNKTAYIDGEKCTVVLDMEKANEYKEQVAKILYRLLWDWLGEFVNQKLCKDDYANFIALVDFPSLTNSPGHRNEGNSLSTLCLNLASERLSAFVAFSLFPQAAYESQIGDALVPSSIVKSLSAPSSALESIRVMTNQPGGLVHIIDDQSVRKGKNERTMIDAMGKRWGKNRQFAWRKESSSTSESGTRAGTFTIEHWSDAELITYSTQDFLEKNLNLVPSDFVELLGGMAVPQVKGASSKRRKTTDSSSLANQSASAETSIIGGSSNAFVKELFANEVVTATASEKATLSGSTPESASSAKASGGLAVSGSHASRKPSLHRKGSTRQTGDQRNEDDGSGEPEDLARAATLGRKKTVAVRRAEILLERCMLGSFNRSLDDLFETLSDSCRLFVVYCLSPTNSADQPGVDVRLFKSQIKALRLNIVRDRCASAPTWVQEFEFKDFWERYSIIQRWQEDLVKKAAQLMWKDKMQAVKEEMEWTDQDFAVGKTRVWLSDSAFRQLEDYLRAADQDEQKRKREFQARSSAPEADPYSPFSRFTLSLVPNSLAPDQASPFGHAPRPYNHPAYAETASTAALPLVGGAPFGEDDDHKSFLTDDEYAKSRFDLEEGGRGTQGETGSYAPSRMFNELDATEKSIPVADEKERKETIEVYKETTARKQWKFLVWCFTWWIPTFLLTSLGRMKRPDVRMAWREKVTIFMLITLLCGTAVFVIAIMGRIICPTEFVYSTQELSDHSFSNNQGHELVAIRGEVFDLTRFANVHYPSVVPSKSVQMYGGLDASDIFPVQVSALCNGNTGSVSPWVTLDTSNTTDPNAVYHDFRAFTNDSRPDWYWEQMVFLRFNFRTGFMGYTTDEVSDRATTTLTKNTVIYRGYVYDMTGYITNNGGGVRAPAGFQAPSNTDRQFMDDQVVSLFQQYAGQDITNKLDNLNIDSNVLAAQKVCLRNLFFIGKVDTRNSPQCLFSNYILLAFSIVMVAIIGFKFIAALQFGRARQPENHDRFVVMQVPCYTEGEDSLRDCIESLASLKYDDKRKLLFVICDGMIIGSGNDRPTPRIVLDLLGADPALDPEPLSFLSLGEGMKQHNMGKVYSGLYEHAGHVIPYIVLVKVGKPSERSRPGNRGKRDSQMLFMRFFNRVHFDAPMSPCELELYHQIKNVIGVNPTFYEFLLAIDADTVVDPLSLNRFISAMVHDRKVLASCGETELANAKHSIISMMQVYEYFISHHLAKAFESLFGSVTCLPGCFSMYRLRSVENKPLFISNDVVSAFGENRVDTLHMKNLLHLGEDRYLTTLLLKNFPNYKLTFTRDAHAKTIAPEEWKVLLSQRRRWINSTIHNLAELIGRVDRLCGFCCCSMRAVVLIDLLSTLIQPVTVAYIIYLIYLVASHTGTFPLTALIMLGAIYGLQAIIFILHRKFEMIVWMIIYLLAIPIFSFALPIYSFWRQDDFSWGETRIVLGEKGKKLVIHDEGEFDPKEIPLKSWYEYENELWERGSNASIGQILAEKEKADATAYARDEGSIYGNESALGLPPGGGCSMSRSRTPMSELGARSFHQALNSYGGTGPMAGYAQSQVGSVIGVTPFGHPAQSSGGFPQFAEGYEMQGSQAGQMSQNPFAPRQSLPISQRQSRQSLGAMSAPMLGTNGAPTDEQLLVDIRAILARADLQTLTKKGVKEELEKMYGVDLSLKKAFINSQIEDALSNLY